MVHAAIGQPAVAAPTSPRPDIPSSVAGDTPPVPQSYAAQDESRPLWEIERDAIEGTISRCEGNIQLAARKLEISPSTIYRKREAWERKVAS